MQVDSEPINRNSKIFQISRWQRETGDGMEAMPEGSDKAVSVGVDVCAEV